MEGNAARGDSKIPPLLLNAEFVEFVLRVDDVCGRANPSSEKRNHHLPTVVQNVLAEWLGAPRKNQLSDA